MPKISDETDPHFDRPLAEDADTHEQSTHEQTEGDPCPPDHDPSAWAKGYGIPVFQGFERDGREGPVSI